MCVVLRVELVAVLATSFASMVTIGRQIHAAGGGHLSCSVFHILAAADAMVTMGGGDREEKGDELGHEISTNSSVLYIRKLMVLTVGVPPNLIQMRLVVDTHWP